MFSSFFGSRRIENTDDIKEVFQELPFPSFSHVDSDSDDLHVPVWDVDSHLSTCFMYDLEDSSLLAPFGLNPQLIKGLKEEVARRPHGKVPGFILLTNRTEALTVDHVTEFSKIVSDHHSNILLAYYAIKSLRPKTESYADKINQFNLSVFDVDEIRYISILLKSHPNNLPSGHVLYYRLKTCFDLIQKYLSMTEANARLNPIDIFLTSVAKNTEQLTKVKCLRISTPADIDEKGCGLAYDNRMRAFEAKAIATAKQHVDAKENRVTFTFNFPEVKSVEYCPCKNERIIQTARWLSAQYPNNKIHMHFSDDQIVIIQRAKTINVEALPANIKSISLHWYNIEKRVFEYRGCITRPKAPSFRLSRSDPG